MENNLKINETENFIIEDDVDLLLNILKHKIYHKIDEGSQEKFFQKDIKGYFLTKNFEYIVEINGYYVAFQGTIEGRQFPLFDNGVFIAYKNECMLENINIDGRNNTSINFDILSNKCIISEELLEKLEVNIYENIKKFLD